MEILEESSAPCFTYMEKEMRPRFMTVKGFPAFWEEDRVLSELMALGLKDAEFLAAERMWTKFSDERGIRSNLFKIKLKIRGSIQQVIKLKEIAKFKVTFAMFSSIREVVQCFRCQRVGRTSPNCKMPRRCVKCSLAHASGGCLTDRIHQRAPLKCALCSLGHTANSPLCLVHTPMRGRTDNRQKGMNWRRRVH